MRVRMTGDFATSRLGSPAQFGELRFSAPAADCVITKPCQSRQTGGRLLPGRRYMTNSGSFDDEQALHVPFDSAARRLRWRAHGALPLRRLGSAALARHTCRRCFAEAGRRAFVASGGTDDSRSKRLDGVSKRLDGLSKRLGGLSNHLNGARPNHAPGPNRASGANNRRCSTACERIRQPQLQRPRRDRGDQDRDAHRRHAGVDRGGAAGGH